MAIALIEVTKGSLIIGISVVALVGLIWLVVYIWRDTPWMARALNNWMPASWRPQGVWDCLWKYREVSQKRGRRYCAQRGREYSERNHKLVPWNPKVAVKVGNHLYPMPIVRRPPFICEDVLRMLQDTGCIGLLIQESKLGSRDAVVFMGNGGVSIEKAPSVGEGLKNWALSQRNDEKPATEKDSSEASGKPRLSLGGTAECLTCGSTNVLYRDDVPLLSSSAGRTQEVGFCLTHARVYRERQYDDEGNPAVFPNINTGQLVSRDGSPIPELNR